MRTFFCSRVFVALVAVVGCIGLLADVAHAGRERDDRDEEHGGAAYRVGSAAARIALLPIKCARDMDTALCGTIEESLAVDLARDPRIDIVSPRDLEVLLGAQQIVELSSCEGDSCFDANNFTQIEATYLMSVSIGRIGGDAMITVRLVDLKRGVVIDRDDARAWRGSEDAIDEATKVLARTILVRRGVATPPRATEEDRDDGSPVVFWGGAGATGLGAVGLLASGGLGMLALVEANALKRSTGLTQAGFNEGAATAEGYAFGSDLLLVAGGALTAGGVAMMIAGSL